MEELNFRLPDVVRVAWVSEEARSAHQPQIERVRKAWSSAEWRSVAARIRPCARVMISPKLFQAFNDDVSAQGLKVYPLRVIELTSNRKNASSIWMEAVVGTRRDAKLFVKAWKQRDTLEMGRMLGYPPCCTNFYRTIEVRQLIDHTWLAAMNTKTANREDRAIRITAPDLPWGNTLLRKISLMAVQHLPCSFDCARSLELAAQFIGLMRDDGYEEETRYLTEALAWPMEWSGLHGIAEIRTPVVKICTRTDSTAQKVVVQWLGSQYPSEGARGLTYPFIIRHSGSDRLVTITEESYVSAPPTRG